MKIVSVIGARPQFIKSAPVSKAIAEAGYQEYQIHTGQHYDYGMSRIFFEELDIPEPDTKAIVQEITQQIWPSDPPTQMFGDGYTSDKIVRLL